MALPANGGNDGNTGAIGSPWATVHRAWQTMSAGDTLYIRGGIYAQRMNSGIQQVPLGTASQRITFRAFTGETVRFRPAAVAEIVNFFAWTHATDIAYLDFINLIFDGSSMTWQDRICTMQGDEFGGGAPTVHHLRFFGCEFGPCLTPPVFPTTDDGNFGVQGAFNNCLFADCYMHDFPGGYCMYFAGWNNVTRRCTFTRTYGFGIQHFVSGPSTVINTGNVIEQCTFTECGAAGNQWGAGALTINDAHGFVVRNNVFANNPMGAIQYSLFENLSNLRVVNNTFYNNATASGSYPVVQLGFSGSGTPVNSQVQNNIFYVFGGPGTIGDGGSGSVLGNNWETGDPGMIAPASGNFALLATSPCRDAGANLSGLVDVDFAGLPRPQNGSWDIGAYEFDTGGVPALPRRRRLTLLGAGR